MGFPVGYWEFLILKFLDGVRCLLFLPCLLVSRAIGLGGRSNSDSSSFGPRAHHPNLKFKPASAVVIQEILPIVRYRELGTQRRWQEDEEGEMCTVCLCELEAGEEVRRLSNCRHVFHACCLDPWVELDQRTCPTCRDDLVPVEERETFETRVRQAEAIALDEAFADLLSATQ